MPPDCRFTSTSCSRRSCRHIVIATIASLALCFTGCKRNPKFLHGVWQKSWRLESFGDDPPSIVTIVFEFNPDGTGKRFIYHTPQEQGPGPPGEPGEIDGTPWIAEETPITWTATGTAIHLRLEEYEADLVYRYTRHAEGRLRVSEEGLSKPLTWSMLDLTYEEAVSLVESGSTLPKR